MTILTNTTNKGFCFELEGRVTVQDISHLQCHLKVNTHYMIFINMARVVSFDKAALKVLSVLLNTTHRCAGRLYIDNMPREELGNFIKCMGVEF